MTLRYQTVVDPDGNPTAGQIPWSEFKALLDEIGDLEDEGATPEVADAIEKANRDRAEGNDDAFTDLGYFCNSAIAAAIARPTFM